MQTLKQKLLPIKAEFSAKLKDIETGLESIVTRKNSLETEADTLRREMALLSKLLDDLAKDNETTTTQDTLSKNNIRNTNNANKIDKETNERVSKIYEYLEELGSKSKGIGFAVNCERIRKRLNEKGNPVSSNDEIASSIYILEKEGWLKIQSPKSGKHTFIIQMMDGDPA